MTRTNDLPALLGGQPVRPAGPPDWPPDDPQIASALQQVLADRSWGKYHGPHVRRLAEQLAAYHRVDHVVLCCSGTVAVELALRGLRIGPGDEVVLSAYDFPGNFHDVLTVGARPVLADLAAENWNLDPAQLEAAVGPATKAILVSHLHGGIVPMPAVVEFARRHGLAVIEDACQMPGAVIAGRKAGTWGDVGVLSFGGSKLLSAGRGGAVLTNDSGIAQRVRLYTQRGNEAYPLSELQAAALLPQLARLDERNQVRAQAAAALTRLLAGQPGLVPLRNAVAGDRCASQPGYYKFGLQYQAREFGNLPRDVFAEALRAEGIAVDPGFRALHRSHSRRRFRALGPLSIAAQADQCMLTLHHPVLLEGATALEEIGAAVDKIRRYAEQLQSVGKTGPFTGNEQCDHE